MRASHLEIHYRSEVDRIVAQRLQQVEKSVQIPVAAAADSLETLPFRITYGVALPAVSLTT